MARLIPWEAIQGTLKYGLKKYFKTKAGIDIDDGSVSEMNDVYTAKCVELKNKG